MVVFGSQASTSDIDHAQAPLLNEHLLNELLAATGPDVFQEIVDAFWPIAHELRTELSRAQEAGSQQQLRENAHSLRGAAGNVGGARIAALCAQLEVEPLERAPELLEALDEALSLTPLALAQRIAA